MDALKKLKVVELKQILRDNGLRVGGTKSELIARIYENDINISKPYIHKGKMKWSAYTVSELKQALKDFGLPLSGKKEMLVKRLEDTGLDDIAASDYYAAEIAKVSPVKKKSDKPIKVKKDVEYIPLVDTLKILEPVNKSIVIKRSVRPKEIAKEIAKVSPVKKQVTEKVPKKHPFRGLTWSQLKLFLSRYDLSTKGLKEDLIARLIEYFKNKSISEALRELTELYARSEYDAPYLNTKYLQNVSNDYNLQTSGSNKQLIDRIVAYELQNDITRLKFK